MPRIRPKGLPRGGFPVSKDNVVRVPLANVLSWDQLYYISEAPRTCSEGSCWNFREYEESLRGWFDFLATFSVTSFQKLVEKFTET